MPGMNNGLNPDDPTVVAAFRAALHHRGLIAPHGTLTLTLRHSGTVTVGAPVTGPGTP
jgi:hypothetical protein